ncbi:DsrE family protein [Plasticicumulans sp.]|uniref:DsrE family protein n=1 Tax=Plasticicumulans sp. TaxID=2307179 RepID=UPI002BC471F8|nr:DsrE family protein [Pseudomonadota bacterium]HNF64638.1 DsrE family protein [Plasticicumulans sp.]
MADKLLMILANTDPGSAVALHAVFAQATVAAAMEYDVEIVLTGRTGRLATPGYAETVALAERGRTALDLIREAHEAGVRFKICTSARESADAAMIAEIAEIVGGAYIISEAMDDATVTFTY